MKSYIEQLEEQNDELQKRLAALEHVAEPRSPLHLWGGSIH
jgi:hypothetical protein